MKVVSGWHQRLRRYLHAWESQAPRAAQTSTPAKSEKAAISATSLQAPAAKPTDKLETVDVRRLVMILAWAGICGVVVAGVLVPGGYRAGFYNLGQGFGLLTLLAVGVIGTLATVVARALNTSEAQSGRLRAQVHIEEQFRALLENAPDGVVVTGPDGRILLVNAQTEILFGYSRRDLIGQTIEMLIPERFRKRHIGHRTGYTSAPRVRPMGMPGMQLFGRRRDGSEFPAEISLSPTTTDEGTLVTAVVRDVSERKRLESVLRERAEELARSNAELEQFAYVVSHDLQEPLRMVASFTQLLAKRYGGQMGAEADQFIGFAVDGAVRMQRLINDLLTYSRVGSRGGPSEPSSCEEALSRSLANLAVAIQESGAVVTHDPLPPVKCDPSQLEQLLQNLIGNAIKFRSQEPPQIHVSAQRRDADWLFSVRDNGIGIDPRYENRIFLIFQRLHARTEYPGSGIGLAICKKIVERLGGRIWFESTPGEGATFFFTVPDGAIKP